MQGKFKPYDIYVPENDIKVEVKKDIGSKETPNYFTNKKERDIIKQNIKNIIDK